MKRLTDKQKRAAIRKAKRLAAADLSRRTGKNPDTREVIVKLIRGKDEMAFQTRTGYLSPRTGPVYTVSDLDIAEAIDNPGHLVQVCAKLGFVVLAHALRYRSPKPGVEALTDMATKAAEFMKLDLDALRKAIELDRQEQEEAQAKAQAAEAAADNAAADQPPAFEGTVEELQAVLDTPEEASPQ